MGGGRGGARSAIAAASMSVSIGASGALPRAAFMKLESGGVTGAPFDASILSQEAPHRLEPREEEERRFF